jgi:hypothetical protein
VSPFTLVDIAAILSAVAALGSCVVGWSNMRRIQEVHLSVNSRLDQLLAVTKAKAYENGMAEQRARHLEDNPGIAERKL